MSIKITPKKNKYHEILIVDDNENNQNALEKLIKRFYKSKTNQVKIKKLNDGIELLNEIYKDILTKSGNKNHIKIIFCDEMMNYMNGSEAYQIIKKICKEKKIKLIPFVICSSFAQKEHFEKMSELEIENVYVKPLSYGNVEFILNSILRFSIV